MKKIIPLLFFLFIVRSASAQTYYIYKIAGDSLAGYNGDGIPAIDAYLFNPLNSCTDGAGNLYIADVENSRVRKVGLNGIITTVAGTGGYGFSGDGGQATDAELASPTAVTCDDSGNLYIDDYIDNDIRKVNTQGIITTIAGNGTAGYSGDGGPATAAELNEPRGVILDDTGNIYIADQTNERIRKINKAGIITTFAGNGKTGINGNDGPADSAEFNDPGAIALDDSGNMYVADNFNNVIRKINKKGIITNFAGNGGFNVSGDGGPATDAQIDGPLGVAADRWGNVYIADQGSERIRKVYTNGIINSIAGTGVEGYSGNAGPALSAKLGGPIGVYVDGQGNVFITEYSDGNNDVRELIINCSIQLTLNPPAALLCSGQSITLKAGGANNYQWYPTIGLTATTGDSVMASPTSNITYFISASDSAGCSTMDSITVDVFPSPVKPTITVSVTHDSLISSSATDNQWYLNDTLITDSTGQVLLITDDSKGSYSVSVTNEADGCTSTSDTVLVTGGGKTTGINQLSIRQLADQLSIYPNPTNGIINISSSKNIDAVTVTNLVGQVIYTSQPKQTSYSFELSEEGMYFITVLVNDEIITNKIILSR